jgi:Uncharacterised nucleotidyltransferase
VFGKPSAPMSTSLVQPAATSAVVPPSPALSCFSPEFDLLLACCADPSGIERRIHAVLQPAIDWQHFAEIAEHHGVIPRVYETLSATVAAGRIEPVRELYESNARRALWLTRELVRVLEHFASREIPTLPYKGPVLSQSLYGSVSHRQFSDLDVLIHAQDFSRAKAALRELGFEPGMELSSQEERAYLRSGYEFTFDGPNGRNLLELQWQILPRFYSVDFGVEGFFDRAVTLQVGGVPVHSLCAEDMLLVLCAHTAKHAWIQLSWLCDIAELARTPLDWERIRRQSAVLGITRIVAVTFLLAHQLLGTSLPLVVELDPAARSLTKQMVPILARSERVDTESMPYFRLMARARERRHDRSRFWWRLATTPSVGEWSAIQLPAPLFPLYRVVRVLRLARRLF